MFFCTSCFVTQAMVVIRYPEGRYEGEVNADGDPEGFGVLEYPGNDEHERMVYEGEFKAKKAHGKGLMKWREGDKYEGDWIDGLRHGKGTYFSKARLSPDTPDSLMRPN